MSDNLFKDYLMRSASSTAPACVATLIGAARLPFLGLSITSLLLGIALASGSVGRLDSPILALALLGGLLAHLGSTHSTSALTSVPAWICAPGERPSAACAWRGLPVRG